MTIQTNCLGVDTCTYKISKQVGFEVHVFFIKKSSSLVFIDRFKVSVVCLNQVREVSVLQRV